MLDAGKYVRSSFRNLDFASLVQQPVDALLGVSPAAQDELRLQNIDTIFDLATASLFNEATMLVAAADSPDTDWAVAGAAPKTVVDTAIAALPVATIADRDIGDLRSFSQAAAARASTALNVTTIRELAMWPPYAAARSIYQELIGKRDPASVWDPGTPPELLPTMGRHPTERAYYQTILLDRFIDPPPPPASPPTWFVTLQRQPPVLRELAPRQLGPVAVEAAGQVDIAAPLLHSPGFEKVAVGALVQFSQSWYSIGLALGQLAHALALAPGESTRVAMIDWRRRESGSLQQSTSELDRLDSQLVNTRALSEVVNAVAHEVQNGSSGSHTRGESWGVGKSGGGGGSYGGDNAGYGFGGGYSIGYGSGNSDAMSWGVSFGQRDLRSELTQNIQDLTQQASTMARNRWATTVREVMQEEQEQLSTRAVTNYNHMHALTMQYYEVVQTYRVAVAIERITRCLFVPMRVLDFSRREIVSRFRGALATAALIPQLRTIFRAGQNMLIMSLPTPNADWDLLSVNRIYGPEAWNPGERDAAIPADDWEGLIVGTNDEGHPFRSLVVERQDGTTMVLAWTIGDRKAPDAGSPFGLFDFVQVPRLQPDTFKLDDIRRVLLRRDANTATFKGEVSIQITGRAKGHNFDWVGGEITIPVAAGTGDLVLFTVERGFDYSEVAEHLRDNALYYSQAIWRSLDAASISLALAGYTFGGRSLLEAVDPMPLGVAGNYLIFRTYATDAAWESFLDDKKLRIGPVSSQVVPLPTGGIFGEAVLGRANSAEKLDITRFWNWQDSPIPIAAPEIAALQAGTRAQPTNLETGQLSPSVLNIINPAPLPDPTGMTAALTALAQGAMFRDMSGLAGTIGLAGTSLQEAYKGSSDAQRYAVENFRIAASLIPKGGKQSTTTEQGAKAVQGQNMDARQRSDPGSVGEQEIKAFESTLSPPPLVDARTGAPVTSPGSTNNRSGEGNGSGGAGGGGGTGRGTADGIPAGQLLTSADGGVAPVVDAERLTADVMAGINSDARLRESLAKLLSDGWDIRRTNIYFGNSSVDTERKIIYIDDDKEPVATTTQWATDAVRKAYKEDDDYRRRIIRDKATTIFSATGDTDLEKMATLYEWAGWFWRYPSDDGDPRGLMEDMMLVLTETNLTGTGSNDQSYYIWAPRRLLSASDTGFKFAFRDGSNQVRHATGSIWASFGITGPAGYLAMQLHEGLDSSTADWRLNSVCFDIGSNMHVNHPTCVPKRIGATLRRLLGDPTQTAPWTGPSDGAPNVPPPW